MDPRSHHLRLFFVLHVSHWHSHQGRQVRRRHRPRPHLSPSAFFPYYAFKFLRRHESLRCPFHKSVSGISTATPCFRCIPVSVVLSLHMPVSFLPFANSPCAVRAINIRIALFCRFAMHKAGHCSLFRVRSVGPSRDHSLKTEG